jgi:CheY-like chemotaxis protein
MLGLYLRLAAYSVELAHDGRDAVEKALSLRPAAIVMDLEMPKLNGWQAIGSLRAHGHTASIPIIVLSGHRLGTSLETAVRALGAQSFLAKPCEPERIASEIAARLRDSPRVSRIVGASPSADGIAAGDGGQ